MAGLDSGRWAVVVLGVGEGRCTGSIGGGDFFWLLLDRGVGSYGSTCGHAGFFFLLCISRRLGTMR